MSGAAAAIGAIGALIVDDDDSDAIIVQRVLREAGLTVRARRVDTRAAVIDALCGHAWDVVLCDYSLPALDFTAVCDVIGELGLRLPVILVSGTVGEEVVADLMRAGAADVVLKDRLRARLAPVVLREVARAREQAEAAARRQNAEALLAAFDNAQSWREAVEASLAHLVARFQAALAVMWAIPGPDGVLTPIASSATAELRGLQAVLQRWRLPVRETLVGRSFLQGETCVVLDIAGDGAARADDSALAGRVRAFQAHGINYVLFQALEAGGRQFAVSVMFVTPPAAPARITAELAGIATSLRPALFRKLIEYERDMLLRALDATRSGVFITDAVVDPPGPTILYANQAVCSLSGYDMQGLIGNSPRILQGPGTERTTLDAVRRALLAAEPISVQLRNYRRDRSAFLVELDITPVRDHDMVTNFIAIQTDITSRQQAEEARRAAEADLHAVVRLGPGVLYRAQVATSGQGNQMQAGQIQAAQIQAAQIHLVSVYGDSAPLAAVLGDAADIAATVTRLLHEPDSVALLRGIAAESGRSAGTIDLAVTWSGAAMCWLRHAVRVTRRTADMVEVVGSLFDVTAGKQEQLRLQGVQTLITLGEMATGMAHELNQPLSSITFAAQNAIFLLAQPSPDLRALTAKLAKIAAEADRAAKLIDHMRVFARNDQRELVPTHWHGVLCGALAILEARLRDFVIRADVPAELPPVRGPKIPMEQILINLLGNAMDAYESAAAPVEPAARLLLVDGFMRDGKVVLRVADRAGGIPEHVLPRLFEPFFTTKRVGKGTGLGLALCFGTVSEMQGKITAHNEAGGAVFEIVLAPADAERPGALPLDQAGDKSPDPILLKE